jgi:hypothetical protein
VLGIPVGHLAVQLFDVYGPDPVYLLNLSDRHGGGGIQWYVVDEVECYDGQTKLIRGVLSERKEARRASRSRLRERSEVGIGPRPPGHLGGDLHLILL